VGGEGANESLFYDFAMLLKWKSKCTKTRVNKAKTKVQNPSKD
jgi:hypothetical protein